jgi:hypothetical protein
MTRQILLASTLLLLTAIPDAAAQRVPPTENPARAREFFERGVLLMDNEDWEPALVQLQRSFDLHPTQVALFNVGLCLKALHRYQDAIAAFERLLQQFATDGSEERRTLARTEIQNLRAFFGTVRILVSVPGAEILVDGAVVGTSPLANSIALAGGSHVVQARRPGFALAEQRVTVVAGDTIAVTLEPRQLGPPPTSNEAQPAPAPVRPPAPPPAQPPAWQRAPPPVAPTISASRMHEERETQPEPAEHGVSPVWFWSTTTLAGIAAVSTGILGTLVLTEDAAYEADERRTSADQDAGKQLMLFTDVSLGIGVVAAVVAIVLYTQTDFRGGTEDRATALRPMLALSPLGATAGVGGAY